LIYAFILVRIIPLRWFSSLLGELNYEINVELNEEQKLVIQQFQKNIRRWKRRLPWKVKCFEEAIAGKKVLNKFGIKTSLFLGVAKGSEKNLTAHAWLKSGSIFVTGEKGYKKYSIVGTYS
jgi:hypothetical protein